MPTWGVSLIDSRVAVGHKSEVIVQLFDGKKLYLYPYSRADCDRWVDLLQRASRRKIGNYYGVTGLVGMGSFAEVRIGYDKSTGQQVAIKVMKKNKRDTELMRSVECEMNFISKNIDHENIVSTYDVFDTRDNLFIVMEYMNGGMLYDILANEGYFTEKNASLVMKDLLLAVDCLHANDIVHRDIKPENVLAYRKDWPLNVKLADFGLADFVLENSFGEKSTCGMYGTPFFVAPEVIKAETYTPAVDIWSLGVLAYNMLSGKLPFDGNNIKEVLRKVRAGKYTFPDGEWADISSEAKDLIKGLLEVNPKKRLSAKQALAHPWISSSNLSERIINNDRSALGYEQRKLRMSSMAIDDVAGLLRLEEEDEQEHHPHEKTSHHHHAGGGATDLGIRALSRLFPGKSGKSSRSSGSTHSHSARHDHTLPPRHELPPPPPPPIDNDSTPATPTHTQQHQIQLQPSRSANRHSANAVGSASKRPPPSPSPSLHQQSRSRPQTPTFHHQQHQHQQQQQVIPSHSIEMVELENSSAAVTNALPLRLGNNRSNGTNVARIEEEETTGIDEPLSTELHQHPHQPYNAPIELPGWNDTAGVVNGGGNQAVAGDTNAGAGYTGGLEFNHQFVGGNGDDGFALPAILSVKDIMRRRHEQSTQPHPHPQQQHQQERRRRHNGKHGGGGGGGGGSRPGDDTSDSELE